MAVTPRRADGHDTHGRTHAEADERAFEFQSDAFFGRRGYQHFGASLAYSIDDESRIGLGSHFVREESGAETFPSLGAEYSRVLKYGLQAELFSFGYFPVAGQRAIAFGTRLSKTFERNDSSQFVAFAGATVANVRAIDEETGEPQDINHLLVLGGITWRIHQLNATISRPTPSIPHCQPASKPPSTSKR